MAARAESLGAGEILLTSMDGDGTKAGYDLRITRQIADAVSIPVRMDCNTAKCRLNRNEVNILRPLRRPIKVPKIPRPVNVPGICATTPCQL